MTEVENDVKHKIENKCFSYKIGKYKINVRREFEKQGSTILENVMCLIYDEMEARKNKKGDLGEK